MHPAINPQLRSETSKTLLKLFPIAVQPADLKRSAIFALQAAGGADDVFILGPYSRPSIVSAISYISALDAATTRTFTIHLTSSGDTNAIVPNDVNVLDAQSPSPRFMPGRTNIVVPIGKASPFNPFWLKLSRSKGGSITFEMTCWIYLSQVP